MKYREFKAERDRTMTKLVSWIKSSAAWRNIPVAVNRVELITSTFCDLKIQSGSNSTTGSWRKSTARFNRSALEMLTGL